MVARDSFCAAANLRQLTALLTACWVKRTLSFCKPWSHRQKVSRDRPLASRTIIPVRGRSGWVARRSLAAAAAAAPAWPLNTGLTGGARTGDGSEGAAGIGGGPVSGGGSGGSGVICTTPATAHMCSRSS